jgi:hypothetical protein
VPEPPVKVAGVKVHAELSFVKATLPLNPFNGEMIMVEVPGTSTTEDTIVGVADMLKSGAPAMVTVTPTVVGVVVAPRGEPLTWKLYEPAATEDATLIVKPPRPVGITGLTVKLPQVIPDGRPEQDSVTARVVPPVRVAVNITVPEPPC